MRQAPVFAVVFAVYSIALATSSVAADQRVTVCGAIESYTPAAATANGSVVVGTQKLVLASGSSVSSVNPPIQPGTIGCFTGTRHDDGSFVDYGVTPFPTSYCGTASAFAAATASTAGSITLGTNAIATFTIPAGTSVTATVGGPAQCYSLAIASSGDAVVTGNAGAPQVGVAGPSTAPTGNLPSTSTGTDPFPVLAVGGVLALLVAIRAVRMRTANRVAH